MPILLIVLGTGALAWVLKETDYIIPVTAALVLMLVVTAINPGVAVFMLMAMAAIIVASIIIAFLPQVMGFLLGALILVVCIILAGGASAAERKVNEQTLDFESCSEAISDIAEYSYYNEGWKDAKPQTFVEKKEYSITVFKGPKEVEMTCKDGKMMAWERDHEAKLQIEIKPMK